MARLGKGLFFIDKLPLRFSVLVKTTIVEYRRIVARPSWRTKGAGLRAFPFMFFQLPSWHHLSSIYDHRLRR